MSPAEDAPEQYDEVEEEGGAPLLDLQGFVRDSPPWLISAVVHMVVFIICAILLLATDFDPPITLDARYAEKLGDFNEIAELDIATTDEEVEQEISEVVDLPIVSDPLSMPPIVPPAQTGFNAVSQVQAPTIGLALKGREPGMKNALTLAYGGDKLTAQSVAEGLAWLARNQQRDGSWSLRGPYRDGASAENKLSATAMALLAFQGDGHTHQRSPVPEYVNVVKRGWTWLLKQQDSTGYFRGDMPSHHALYTHGQCTIAICELYGMTGDEEFRAPAQKAVDFAVEIQTQRKNSKGESYGGWRYYPRRDEDLSVTGWFAMALQSARMAGLEVPSMTFDRLSKYLDEVQKDGGAKYAYRPSEGPRPSMSAEGLLCRQYLGWQRSDERLARGTKDLLNYLPNWDAGRNVYHWYYATQVFHHMEGDAWVKWNTAMKKTLPTNQEKAGKERGSWDPRGDRHATPGGRLYVTCLSIYMLEVYYRHLPIYRESFTGY